LQNGAGGGAENSGIKISAGANGARMPTAQTQQQNTTASPLEALQPISVAHSAWTLGKRVIGAELNFALNTVQLRTGSTELQQQLQFGYEVGSFLANTGESIALGAAVGGAPTAILAAVTSIASSMYNIALQQRTLDMQTAVENTTQKMNSIRAGTGGSRQGIAGRI
jgi:hypothetical protein